ncbi:MAG: hypothetical protein IT327_07910 [Anaerolineae bacterium]|jgi:hypothetical protein|nr:hypothetical protein [Anaerolineae bacterium]
MSEPLPAYTTTSGRSGKTKPLFTRPPADLTTKAVKLARRVQQVATEPGEYQFTLIVHEDGRWQLKPPPPLEELGQ